MKMKGFPNHRHHAVFAARLRETEQRLQDIERSAKLHFVDGTCEHGIRPGTICVVCTPNAVNRDVVNRREAVAATKRKLDTEYEQDE